MWEGFINPLGHLLINQKETMYNRIDIWAHETEYPELSINTPIKNIPKF